MKKAGYLALLLTWTLWIRTISQTSDTWSAAPGLASSEKCLASVKTNWICGSSLRRQVRKNTVIFTSNNSP